jgi:hypothetical protein
MALIDREDRHLLPRDGFIVVQVKFGQISSFFGGRRGR